MTFIKAISLHFETYLRYLNISMDQDLIIVFPWTEAAVKSSSVKSDARFLLFDETFNRRNILTDEFINRRKHLTDELFTIFKNFFRQFLGQIRTKLKILQYSYLISQTKRLLRTF